MIRYFFVYLALVFLPLFTFADTSSFLISVFGGEDLEPPTTPTLLSVEPIASTQIDVTWSVSTDNVQLSGYVLFRDSIAIATTTLTSFSDTGLTASTTYMYEVYAFDAFNNISTTSNALATTTLQAPVVPPAATSTDSTSSATLVFQLADFNVIASPRSALFNWETTLPSRFALRWGRSDAHDDGYILNDIYRREHQTVVGDLEPGTLYLYELIGYTPTGRAVVLKTGEFRTEIPSSFVGTPSNVSGLTAVASGADVELSYTLPLTVPNAKVRIVRSYLGFPADAYDGAVVYEGTNSSFIDRGALASYEGMYYTVFVIAPDGSVSSGAVVYVSKNTSGEVVVTPTTPPGQVLPPAESEAELPPPAEEIELVEEAPGYNFDRSRIVLLQGGRTFTFADPEQGLASNAEFSIRIPYEAVPDNLKSIVVTLLDPANPARSYSFLLRINKDRTAYEATIAPINAEGFSRLQVEIFDYERQIVARYQKLVEFRDESQAFSDVVFPDKIVSILGTFFSSAALIAFAAFLLLFLLYRRSRETEDKP